MPNYDELALEMHEKNRGKLEVVSKVPIETKDDLSTAYTPGVAEPCRKIHANPADIYKYTCKGNMVAVVSDGTAVLGLGDIGAGASLPVMEGKAVLFKRFGGVDAFPICIDSKDVDEIVRTVKLIAPVFGGINLEDIGAPRCFEVEDRLKKELDIPVFHDDQHGTAVVVLAGITNAAKFIKKDLTSLKVVINGPGAAGTAVCKILMSAGVKNIVMCGRNGIMNINKPDTYRTWAHKELAQITNPENKTGSLADALAGADVFIGVSKPGVVTKEMVAAMNKDAIIFAMANPTPEIFPDEAKAAGAAVIGTGRSDYPNQVNNVLGFPGIFKGALSVQATAINEEMKLAAARALAGLIDDGELAADYVIPRALDMRVADAVSRAVAKAAVDTGVARIR
jgi:malate dehydrogenase (oxaloacetate-decarboxylating)